MALPKLSDLKARAARWLGLDAPAPAPACTTAVRADRFDDMTWAEIRDQAAAMAALAEDLRQEHDYAEDLIKDLFLGAYKVDPEVREAAEMAPSRLVNRQIVAQVLGTPEWAELRKETAGDPYAAAMAVIAQAGQIRQMTEQARQPQQAADADAGAQEAARQAARDVEQALAAAEAQAGPDGEVPAAAAAAVTRAADAADAAGQAAAETASQAAAARAAAEASLRATARKGAADAAEQARQEADLMDAWGVAPGELRRMNFEQRRRLAERLRSGRIAHLAQLIGRFRRMAAGERARKVEGAPGELTGVTLSADLSRLVPSEMATLAIPAARADFAVRLAEGRLLTYLTTGTDRTGQGAIIAVLDSSGSMETRHAGGITREAWSKALALSLLDQARAARRDMVVLYFGSADELQMFRFPGGRAPAIGDVVEMAEWFFNGGTDFETPLGAAADLLMEEFSQAGKQGGDIAFVTDGVCSVSEEFMASWQARKAQAGFRVFGICLADRPGTVMGALCDNVRGIEDLADPSLVADMFRVI